MGEEKPKPGTLNSRLLEMGYHPSAMYPVSDNLARTLLYLSSSEVIHEFPGEAPLDFVVLPGNLAIQGSGFHFGDPYFIVYRRDYSGPSERGTEIRSGHFSKFIYDDEHDNKVGHVDLRVL